MTTEEATHFFYPETLPDTDGEVESLDRCAEECFWDALAQAFPEDEDAPFDSQIKPVTIYQYRLALKAAEEREAA